MPTRPQGCGPPVASDGGGCSLAPVRHFLALLSATGAWHRDYTSHTIRSAFIDGLGGRGRALTALRGLGDGRGWPASRAAVCAGGARTRCPTGSGQCRGRDIQHSPGHRQVSCPQEPWFPGQVHWRCWLQGASGRRPLPILVREPGGRLRRPGTVLGKPGWGADDEVGTRPPGSGRHSQGGDRLEGDPGWGFSSPGSQRERSGLFGPSELVWWRGAGQGRQLTESEPTSAGELWKSA